MRRAIILIIIFIALLALPFLARQLHFYSLDTHEREELPLYEPNEVPEFVPTPESGTYIDDPVTGTGRILLDLAHDNDFDITEISDLDKKLAARGGELMPFRGGDLANALRAVDSIIVIIPLRAYSDAEVRDVSSFVERGGRVLLVGDPARFDVEEDEEDIFSFVIESDELPLNSLANHFDIVFNGDYLYNTMQNEGNFRNIILEQEDKVETTLTDGLEKLAFYGSHSVAAGPSGRALLEADDNTWSSATDRPGGLALAVTDAGGNVLAMGDIDILNEPYSTVYDNSRFIAHIADFLMNADRGYELIDFPYFLQSGVDLIYVGDPDLGADAFDEIIALQDAFREVNRDLQLLDDPSDKNDVLYLGLYNQAEELTPILELAGITLVIDPPIEEVQADDKDSGDRETEPDEEAIPADEDASVPRTGETGKIEEIELDRLIQSSLGSIHMSGSALILLTADGVQRSLIVLAASNKGLENTVSRLIDLMPADAEHALSDCLLQGDLALCPTGVEDEAVEAELTTGKTPDIPEEEPSEEEEPTADEEEIPESGLDADFQGEIELNSSVEGELSEGQSHAWIFNQGPAIVNIILNGQDDLDSVLELYDPDGQLIGISDSTYASGEERLDMAIIAREGDYTIVVRDFFENGGSYALEVKGLSPVDLDYIDQGELPFNELVEGSLAEDEVHGWSFSVEEAGEVSLELVVDSDLDALVAVFDSDGQLMSVVNDGDPGEPEKIESLTLDTAGQYTVIVVSFDGSGDYSLLLE